MPSGFGELGGGEVVVGALVAPGGDGSGCVGISGSEVFAVRSTLGIVSSVVTLEPDALACNIWEERERVGGHSKPMRSSGFAPQQASWVLRFGENTHGMLEYTCVPPLLRVIRQALIPCHCSCVMLGTVRVRAV